MSDQITPVVEAYIEKTPKSRALYQRSLELFPSGVTHDSRYLHPYPLSVDRADGSHKWDVDGREYVDYFGGHGALLLGHNHPAVVEAVQEQLSKGTHYGASHELELEWAEQMIQMVPCAEKVRFTGSGTESSLLILRLARAYTGRPKILRFTTNFHGWHDQVAFAGGAGFDGTPPAGITQDMVDNTLLCDPNNIDQVKDILASRDDVAAVIIEPTGASFGRVPTSGDFLRELRALTRELGVLLIFDEVITGFRVAPGGAQAHYGVTPDLALFAKIIAGGFPGGAVTGRSDIMDMMTFREDPKWNTAHRVPHQGTFNANPISACAGLTTLRLIADGELIDKANRYGEDLRAGMNEVAQKQGVNWLVYGEFSGFHILPLSKDQTFDLEDIAAGRVPYTVFKGSVPVSLMHQIRCGLMAEGIDIVSWPGGVISAVHNEADLEKTIEGYEKLLAVVKECRIAG
ncbi:MAG: aspartate aminotransferase family protein [Candidatus Latescibacteria bacterium]|nr:aspartate aminotransferase family protein [Candidatus Latescibacterota bacterium]MBT4136367.1 aspartate aminotransferase family protein [Candidatus Latescibacterota bacterium]MBT5830643.1 aspartate aminotransferase family protein [Candidatus Latescibacterota bacterium]